MTWICPNCNRSFKHHNQWHSCLQSSLGNHIVNKPVPIQQCILKLIEVVEEWPHVRLTFVKTSIICKCPSTFLSIMPTKLYVKIEFFLPYQVSVFPIFKSQKISQNRFYHSLKFDQLDEIDEQLIYWIQESYRLVRNSNKV